MSRRPRILFLCQTLPYPPDGGVWIRTYNILRVLSEHYEIDLLAFERAAGKKDGYRDVRARAVEELRKVADTVDIFDIPQRRSRGRFVLDHLRSVLTGEVFVKYLYGSGRLRSRIRQLAGEREYVLAHVDSLDLYGYLPLLEELGIPVACTHHNVESELLRRRSAQESNPVVAAYARLQARLMRKVEARWCGRVALNAAVSERDAAQLEELAPGAEVIVVSNGVDPDQYEPEPGHRDELVFVGGTKWFPNRDALEFFAEEILQEFPEPGSFEVTWIGATRPEDRERYRDEYGIEMSGYVDDIRPLVARAKCYIAPLRVGGGTRLKILDAWAMGKAVVSTAIGCEGLEAVDGDNILIADSPAAFSDAVQRVLSDDELRARLSRRARETAESRYAWSVVAAPLLQHYRQIAERTSAVEA